VQSHSPYSRQTTRPAPEVVHRRRPGDGRRDGLAELVASGRPQAVDEFREFTRLMIQFTRRALPLLLDRARNLADSRLEQTRT
jgi:hypothetical protein